MRRGIIARGEKREKIGEGNSLGEKRIIEWEVEKIKWNKWEKE